MSDDDDVENQPVQDQSWNRTTLQIHIDTCKSLDLRLFVDELIRVSEGRHSPIRLQPHELHDALSNANYPRMGGTSVEDFANYFRYSTTSTIMNDVALGDIVSACIGLDCEPEFHTRCERMRDVVNNRTQFITGEVVPANSVQLHFLEDFVTDHRILYKYRQSWENNARHHDDDASPFQPLTVSLKDLSGIIALHPGLFPGLLAGVSKAAMKRESAAVEKTSLFTEAADRFVDDDDDKEGSMSSSLYARSKSCACCMYVEWGICFVILAMAAATVLAGNWAIASTLVRDSSFSNAGAYWTTSAIDFSILLCFFVCWMQCCRSTSFVCQDTKIMGRGSNGSGGPQGRGAYDYLGNQEQLVDKIRRALGPRGSRTDAHNDGVNNGTNNNSEGGHSILPGQQPSNERGMFGMPKWGGNDGRGGRSGGGSSHADGHHVMSLGEDQTMETGRGGRRSQGRGSDLNLSALQQQQQQRGGEEFSTSKEKYHNVRRTSSNLSVSGLDRVNNGTITQRGWLRRRTLRNGWEKERRDSTLRDLRDADESKRTSRRVKRRGGGEVVAEIVLQSSGSRRATRTTKTIVVTSDHWFDAGPDPKLCKISSLVMNEFCFGIVHPRDRPYYFSCETSRDRDQWEHHFSRLIDVRSSTTTSEKIAIDVRSLDQRESRGSRGGSRGGSSRGGSSRGGSSSGAGGRGGGGRSDSGVRRDGRGERGGDYREEEDRQAGEIKKHGSPTLVQMTRRRPMSDDDDGGTSEEGRSDRPSRDSFQLERPMAVDMRGGGAVGKGADVLYSDPEEQDHHQGYSARSGRSSLDTSFVSQEYDSSPNNPLDELDNMLDNDENWE